MCCTGKKTNAENPLNHSSGEDRHNYEFCLQNVTDVEISSCQLFLSNFSHTCMYLEKCLAPNSYTHFLEV